jgi:hypothetical protein
MASARIHSDIGVAVRGGTPDANSARSGWSAGETVRSSVSGCAFAVGAGSTGVAVQTVGA